MKIGMIGCGKLGLPVALAIESKGHDVVGYDVNPAVAQYLQDREIPYREENLQPLLDTTNIKMLGSIDDVVEQSDLIFLAVQTPHDPKYEGATRIPDDRKDFDYSYLVTAIKEAATACEKLGQKKTLAVISTCLPGTFNREIKHLLNGYVSYVYTPQFIAMGTVLADYLDPEFDLIGVHDQEAANLLQEFYKTINDAPHVITDITTAEAIKVSYNTFITMKTVLGNTWGELCHKTGANVDDVFKAWAISTKRLLSPRYLKAGVGDGGGCHPRDNIALSYIAQQCDLSHNIFEDLMKAREDHMAWIAEEAMNLSKEYNLPIVVLGRSFKPETNIETGSPAVLLTNILVENGLDIAHLEYADDFYPAVYVIATMHDRYRGYNYPRGSIVFDPFRYIPKKDGVKVISIGRNG